MPRANVKPKKVRSARIEVRTTPSMKVLLQRAADSSNKSVTDFLLDAAMTAAQETLADRRVFRLDEGKWNSFVEMLDRPVVEKPRLAKLLLEKGVLD